MIHVRDKKCAGSNQDGSPCTSKAAYNFLGDKARYCKLHAKDGMANVRKTRCAGVRDDGTPCTIYPIFNLPGKPPRYCKAHAQADMVDVCNRKCCAITDAGTQCKTAALFNFPGEPAKYCKSHAQAGMTDVRNKRCKTPLCDILISNPANKGYCYRCFIHTFPDSPLVRNHKTKERTVADHITAKYPHLTCILDRPIEGGCSTRRPDIFIDMGDATIVIEIDENQHKAYDCTCENRRLVELFKDTGSRPMTMIRFNPDDYIDSGGKRIASCWGTTKEKGLLEVKPSKRKEWATRLDALVVAIDCVINADGTGRKEIDVIHLFYDHPQILTNLSRLSLVMQSPRS